jgi:hypothetical protein
MIAFSEILILLYCRQTIGRRGRAKRERRAGTD